MRFMPEREISAPAFLLIIFCEEVVRRPAEFARYPISS
jgi:hypothetical protein